MSIGVSSEIRPGFLLILTNRACFPQKKHTMRQYPLQASSSPSVLFQPALILQTASRQAEVFGLLSRIPPVRQSSDPFPAVPTSDRLRRCRTAQCKSVCYPGSRPPPSPLSPLVGLRSLRTAAGLFETGNRPKRSATHVQSFSIAHRLQ